MTLLGKITVLKTLIIPKLIHKASYLPIQLPVPKKFVKQLNRVLFTFIWGSKWEKIGRSQLCCSIEEGGAKMIDVKQYLTAMKLKWTFRIFNENFVADWKTIENICLKENLLFCVLRSNCKFSSMMMNSLVFLRFSKSTLKKTLKCILDISENIIPGTKFLWLNKFLKIEINQFFMKSFFKAGIYDLYQLKKPNNELFSYDEIAIIFGMTPNN